MSMKTHWETVYDNYSPKQIRLVSSSSRDLALIEFATGNNSASIIDVGSGESTLVDDVLSREDEKAMKREHRAGDSDHAQL